MATKQQAANARQLIQWWRRGGWQSSCTPHPRKKGPGRGSRRSRERRSGRRRGSGSGARRELALLQQATRLQEAAATFGGTVLGWSRVPSKIVKARLRKLV